MEMDASIQYDYTELYRVRYDGCSGFSSASLNPRDVATVVITAQ
jgi:hypothetical protein